MTRSYTHHSRQAHKHYTDAFKNTHLWYCAVAVFDVACDTQTTRPNVCVHAPTGTVNPYSVTPDLRHLGYLEVGLLSPTCHHFTKLWVSVCAFTCSFPKCHHSSSCHREHAPCVSVRLCLYMRIASSPIQIDSTQQSLFFFLAATFLNVRASRSRAEQPAIKHIHWAKSCEPLTCKQLPN